MSHYETLGIEKNASAEEIKSAYRKLAMKHHPDRGGNEKMFQKITEAYETLIDPNKKDEYDHHGPAGFRPSWQEFHFKSGPFTQGHYNPFEDIFSNFGFGEQPRHSRPTNSNLQIKVKISLKHSYLGKTVNFSYPLPSGKNQTAEIKIPPGIENGQTMILSGFGDDSILGVPRGDLIILIIVDKDPNFFRENLSLITSVKIDAFEAMIGCQKNIRMIDDSTVHLVIKPGTQNGGKYTIQGLGFPSIKFGNVKGDFVIQVNVNVPAITDPSLVSLANNLAEKVKQSKK